MSDVTVRTIEEVAPYDGPHAIPGIRFRAVARALGITAWGMNVFEIDAGITRYPEHDHLKDGQEEVYLALRGSATLHAGEESFALEPGTFVRVGPGQKRKILPGPEGVTVLALGATPGKAYEPR